MFAVVEAGGRQVQVSPADVVRVDKLDAQVGSEIKLGKVLLLRTDENTHIGRPVVENAEVHAEVVRHAKDKKIRVFFFRRRKDSKKVKGHRQDFTEIRIQSIVLDGEVIAEAPAVEVKEKVESEPAAAASEAVETPPVEETAEAPAEETAEAPAEETAEATTEETAEATVEETADTPAEESDTNTATDEPSKKQED